ncbi:zinc dependent phospholipase C family protein [Halobacillus sp. A5]|uniref:zinc dependent phospholipase C family protein n=1 Tax=Halobacillus sp. A5 TaxID=2880263 RepID=UPI0020A63E67|nr:zinc dependent phospholipase C family protein [Halobacillus sp. A5]MCP3026776.1 zinc dependent phospholipase C family protein [Halobacillus sp. A5]
MPNVWTHILFAEDICMNIGRNDLLEASETFLYLGAQGPDPFFYYNFWPMGNDHGVNDLGLQLHKEKCGDFLLELIENGRFLKNRKQAYILGFVSHHILDRITHPYVHYKSGYEGNKHQELEVAIDTLMLSKHRHVQTWKTTVSPLIRLRRIERKEVATMLEPSINNHYSPESLPKHFIEKSFKHMAAAQRILFDPFGWKNKWFGPLVSSFSHQPIADQVDYLNSKGETWHHSATFERRTESFEDLYNQAKEEASALFALILDYWSKEEEKTRKEIENVVQNISYDTGTPLIQNHDNFYSEPIV